MEKLLGAGKCCEKLTVIRVEDVDVSAAYSKWSGEGAVGLVFPETDAEIVLHRETTIPRERQLKGWSRAKKLALIQNQTELLKKLSPSSADACSWQAIRRTRPEQATARRRGRTRFF